jgi:penicillin amidase
VNPPSGILGNTNNKTVDRPFPRHLTFRWGDTQRIQRWLTLMQTREVHTRDSFIEAQLDTVDPTSRALLPLIGADLWYTGTPAAEGTPDRLRQRALILLAEWNGEMNEHMPEPLIAQAWIRSADAAADPGRTGAAGRQPSPTPTRSSSSGCSVTPTAPGSGAT